MARSVQIKGRALLFEGVPISDDRKYGCDAPVVMLPSFLFTSILL